MSNVYLPEEAQNNWLLHLFEVTPLPKRRPFQNHRHSWFEIALFKSGTGIYQTAQHTYSINPGDIFVFSCNEAHYITEIGSASKMRLMNLHIDPHYLMDAPYDGISQMQYVFLNRHSEAFENRLPRNSPASSRIRELLLSIETEFLEKEPEYHWAIRTNIAQIFLLLVRELRYPSPQTAQNTHTLENVRAAADYIQNHLSEELTLETISHTAGLSPHYFSTLFRQISGQSLWDYVTARRVERAMNLLEQGGKETILEIATQCGFNNTANFNKMFKKHTGRTPSEYRKHGVRALY